MSLPDSGITAPYNFVPLSAWIFVPESGQQVSAELPFSDGISGQFTVNIETHTPLLVGGDSQPATDRKPGEVRFFKGPDGRPAIPGSSLRGMVRNVLEIAAFGKMRLVDDQVLSVRDLTNGAKAIYRDKMTSKDLKPRSKAGFLQLGRNEAGETVWRLTPHKFCRVAHDELIRHGDELGLKRTAAVKKEGPAKGKYDIWGDKLEVDFWLPKELPPKPGQKKSATITPQHERASLGKKLPGLAARIISSGRLVFTGQPSANTGKKGQKYLEFLFYEPSAALTVEPSVINGFLQVHKDTDEWKYWQPKIQEQQGVPVFYLTDQQGTAHAIGLAMMFRLPYEQSIGDAIDNTNPYHRSDRQSSFHHDLPELLFGTIADRGGMKGRVDLGLARLEGPAEECGPQVYVLNGPKPSYYPSYIQQHYGHDTGSFGSNGQYQSLMNKDAELRGWKRYPVRPEMQPPPAPDARFRGEDNNKVKSALHPLKPGARFNVTVRVHNLRPFELGALVWALTWGNDPRYRHALGMGKAFGLGQVSCHIQADGWQQLRPHKPSHKLGSPADFSEQFVTTMEKAWQAAVAGNHNPGNAPSWGDSEQLTQLRAMAYPELARTRNLRYMELGQHLEMKGREGRTGGKQAMDRHVLPPYVAYAGLHDADLFRHISKSELDQQEAKDREARLLEEEAQNKQAELEAATAHMSPLQKELYLDLKAAQSPEEFKGRAKPWVGRLATLDAEQAKACAKQLRSLYLKWDEWSGTTKKQKANIDTIKKYLDD